MNHLFSVGDLVRCARTGLEAEVIEAPKKESGLTLCGWIDDADNYQEVYFRAVDLTLIKAKEATPEEVKTEN